MLAYRTAVQTLPPARLFSSWELQDHRYEMVDALVLGGRSKTRGENPLVTLLESDPLEGVAEALRSHYRRSEKV